MPLPIETEPLSCPAFTAIIPAAGSGSRMNAQVPKQYLPVLGKPLLLHTVDIFRAMEECRRIIIATDDRERLEGLLEATAATAGVSIVDGGATRQESVANALTLLDDAELALVHDAARPLVEPADVRRVARAVRPDAAAVLGTPVRDTLKIVADGIVTSTPDRTSYWHAQTPQAAFAATFRKGIAEAVRDGVTCTDDVSLLERIGIRVDMVPATGPNPKVTEPGDLPVIEFLLVRRGMSRP